ncbi:MAG: YdcH family protein [Candidatus Methylomirabilales bacterium]
MNETEAQLFARLKEEDAEFRRLAEKHREFDRKVMEFDRIYYLTSDQERKRKELQKTKLKLKDEMYAIMRRHIQAQNATIIPSGSAGPSQDGGYQRKS